MNSAPLAYRFKSRVSSTDIRFSEFSRWAEPFGHAGFNSVHDATYDPSSPFFEFASHLVQDSNKTARLWFIKREHLAEVKRPYRSHSRTGKIVSIETSKFIAAGEYLRFAKAFLNIIAHIRDVRSQPKRLLTALIFLEKALREENKGDNSPALLKKSTFARALNGLVESHYSAGVIYDSAKELELIAGMIQGGYSSSSFRFGNAGFNLIERHFSFVSTVPPRQKKKAINRNKSIYDEPAHQGRLTNEQVACVGLSYRVAREDFGKRHLFTFVAAIAGFALTTTSMRMSELIRLRRDCLFRSQDVGRGKKRRSKIRIYRPKIETAQQIQIPRVLGELAWELFRVLSDYSKEAHEAFSFYVSRFGDAFDCIDELYIPPRFRRLMSKEWLSKEELSQVIGEYGSSDANLTIPQWLFGRIKVYQFVNEYGDINRNVPARTIQSTRLLRLGELVRRLRADGYRVNVSPGENPETYVNITAALKVIKGNAPKTRIIECLKKGKNIKKRVRTSDLKKILLDDFKQLRFRHWPYVDKEKKLRINEALLVYLAPQMNKGDPSSGQRKHKWWCPVPVSGKQINLWLNSRPSGDGGWLFDALRIRDGKSALSISVHATRKFHQTKALLAGANEAFIDVLAGRSPGEQSAFYDQQTQQELLARSIDTFDPDAKWAAVGPAVDDAPPETKVVDRRVFLYENAAPKHVTEIGGCSADWSLNPCKAHYDCMSCNLAVWRKGDQKRVGRINDIYEEGKRIRSIAVKKIADGYDFDSVKRHLRHAEATMARCELIFSAEADENIPVGTMVTFPAAEGLQTNAGRVQWLRKIKASQDQSSED